MSSYLQTTWVCPKQRMACFVIDLAAQQPSTVSLRGFVSHLHSGARDI